MHTSIRTLFVVVAAALSLAAGPARAAPQILGLVASNGLPVPMRCEGAGCTALLASFCLQEARDAPQDGQAYSPGTRGGLSLVVTRASGQRLRLAANQLVSLTLYSGLSTVQASLSLAKLAASGVSLAAGDAISVAVEDDTAILPVPVAGDPDPQTPEEIALATGPLRQLAGETFDTTGAGSADGTRLLGLLINALPAGNDRAPIALDGLLHQVLASAGPGRFDAQTLAEVGEVMQNCQNFPTRLGQAYCLESRQSGLLATMNQDYWAAAGGT
jgi:hypothetical protein